MSEIPTELRYLDTHEWVRREDDDTVTVGITDYAQDALGDVVFVELPELGMNLDKGDEVAVVESVKAASEIYCPLAGEITECNENLEDEPELLNKDPYRAGWIYKMEPSDIDAIDELLDAAEYEEHCESEEHE